MLPIGLRSNNPGNIGQDTQGRESRGSSYRGGDEFSIGDQPEDREGTWANDPAVTAAARRRGDPVIEYSGLIQGIRAALRGAADPNVEWLLL